MVMNPMGPESGGKNHLTKQKKSKEMECKGSAPFGLSPSPRSPKKGCSPSKWPKWCLNGGDPNHLLTGMILQEVGRISFLLFSCDQQESSVFWLAQHVNARISCCSRKQLVFRQTQFKWLKMQKKSTKNQDAFKNLYINYENMTPFQLH